MKSQYYLEQDAAPRLSLFDLHSTTDGLTDWYRSPSWLIYGYSRSLPSEAIRNSHQKSFWTLFTASNRPTHIGILVPILVERPTTHPKITLRHYNMDKSNTAYLETLSYAKLAGKDQNELSRLLKACQQQGFFYLDLVGFSASQALEDRQKALAETKEWFDRPTEEKMKLYQDSVTKG